MAVAGNCNIVDILSKVEWWRTLVGLVIESPVGLVAEVPQARVRNCQPRLNRLGNIDPSTIEWCCRWRHTILVFVNTTRKNRLETCFYRARIVTCSVTAFTKWTGINYPFPKTNIFNLWWIAFLSEIFKSTFVTSSSCKM